MWIFDVGWRPLLSCARWMVDGRALIGVSSPARRLVLRLCWFGFCATRGVPSLVPWMPRIVADTVWRAPAVFVGLRAIGSDGCTGVDACVRRLTVRLTEATHSVGRPTLAGETVCLDGYNDFEVQDVVWEPESASDICLRFTGFDVTTRMLLVTQQPLASRRPLVATHRKMTMAGMVLTRFQGTHIGGLL